MGAKPKVSLNIAVFKDTFGFAPMTFYRATAETRFEFFGIDGPPPLPDRG